MSGGTKWQSVNADRIRYYETALALKMHVKSKVHK